MSRWVHGKARLAGWQGPRTPVQAAMAGGDVPVSTCCHHLHSLQPTPLSCTLASTHGHPPTYGHVLVDVAGGILPESIQLCLARLAQRRQAVIQGNRQALLGEAGSQAGGAGFDRGADADEVGLAGACTQKCRQAVRRAGRQQSS